MGRVMGLDYGAKTVGVAVSSPDNAIALSVETIFRERENKLRRTLARIEELAREYQVSEFVVGLPKNMDASLGERSEKSIAFGQELERRTGLKVSFQDERLTTQAADRTMEEAGVRRENRKEHIDSIAAVYILQGYLDRQAFERKQAAAGCEEDHTESHTV